MKYKLYYKTFDHKIPFDNEYGDAAIGAYYNEYDVKGYVDISEVPKGKNIIVVGTVDEIMAYLGRTIKPIDDSCVTHLKNKEEIMDIKDIKMPCFIKPHDSIKSFSGCIVFYENDLSNLTYNYEGLVRRQELIDYVAEYRCYVTNGVVIGIKQYIGMPYYPLDEIFVRKALKACSVLRENSFTIDIGISKNGKHYVIELNDAWAIGNYGLNPQDYFSFIKNRWFQLINENNDNKG